MVEKIIQIVTNNPEIYWSPDMPYGVVRVDGTPLDVLDRTEELLQQNWSLLSAPLPPNIPIMRGPYRSLVIEESERRFDARGLTAIGKARERYKLERTSGVMEPSGDFAIIDQTMLLRTLRDISLLANT